ncbi:TIGR02679 family protein [Nonomuraea sediminis]|uniref:TIGR02679 family protein n=1 Tax=Nonomuraea sediminis TaxID=2835864 RepID=UPI001BDCD9E2|nr:TIGR02679 family protein [Nonomuraea sediminis]
MRRKLERDRLAVRGHVSIALDENGASRLSGLLAEPISAGRVRVSLAALDHALRSSAAAAGLVSVTAQVTGHAMVDRVAARDAARATWAEVWTRVDQMLEKAGLATCGWAQEYVAGLRRSGLLTRAGPDSAMAAVDQAGTVLATVAAVEPTGDRWPEPRWELAELAARCLGDAHGLDEGRLAGLLVLRAVAAAHGVPAPESAAARRDLWARVGVLPDLVSGTVLVWELRPPGGDAWSAMMRSRADLGLVTHLTMQELRLADVPPAGPGDLVHVCENPQVLQAAARAGVPRSLICLSGNPAGAGTTLIRRLCAGSAVVRYHGDFDWPGVAIARRVYAMGAVPWRMAASDYEEAVMAGPRVPRLAGEPGTTPWDPGLAAAMAHHDIAVHEETVLPVLLSDLQTPG